MISRVLAIVAVALLAAPAHADLSDSGNLTIGGQATIVGTTTVQGSAFSVGGTTFTVAGGSITLGGRLNAASAGIKWADGTTSTTAASGAAVVTPASISSVSWCTPQGTVTQNSKGFSVTVSGSTIAYTSQTGFVEVGYDGTISITNAGSGMGLSLQKNEGGTASFPAPFDSTHGAWYRPGYADKANAGFRKFFKATIGTSISWSLSVYTDAGGSVTINTPGDTISCGTFYVRDTH